MRLSRVAISPVSQKAQIVRRHSRRQGACLQAPDEFGVQPSQIHTWVKLECLTNQPNVRLDRPAGRPPRSEQLQAKLVEKLQTKLVKKNEVIAELMQEHVQLKK